MTPTTNLRERSEVRNRAEPSDSMILPRELTGDYRPIGVVRPDEMGGRPLAGLASPVRVLEPAEPVPTRPRRCLSSSSPYWAYSREQANVPAGRAHSFDLTGARLLMMEFEFGIITRDGHVLREATHVQQEGVSIRNLLSNGSWANPIEVKGRALLPFGRQGRESYWHFTTGIIANLLLAKRHGLFSGIDHLILPKFKRPVFIEMLQACGLPVNDVIALGEGQHVRFEHLRVVSHTGLEESVPSWKWRDLHGLGSAAAATAGSAPSPEKVLIYRRGGVRGFKNGEQVAQLCEQYGFQAFDLEGFTYAGQAALFAGAKQVIAAHGSALTNLFYCQPGTRVCEVFSPWYTVDYFRNLAMAGQLEHTALIGSGFRPNIEVPARVHDSIEVDLDLLRTWLEEGA